MDVEKVYYLRGYLRKADLQMSYLADIQTLTKESLTKNYKNPRLIISEHFDRIRNIKTLTPRNAESLLALISTVLETNKALESLGMSKEMWDLWIFGSPYFSPSRPRNSRDFSWLLKRISAIYQLGKCSHGSSTCSWAHRKRTAFYFWAHS